MRDRYGLQPTTIPAARDPWAGRSAPFCSHSAVELAPLGLTRSAASDQSRRIARGMACSNDWGSIRLRTTGCGAAVCCVVACGAANTGSSLAEHRLPAASRPPASVNLGISHAAMKSVAEGWTSGAISGARNQVDSAPAVLRLALVHGCGCFCCCCSWALADVGSLRKARTSENGTIQPHVRCSGTEPCWFGGRYASSRFRTPSPWPLHRFQAPGLYGISSRCFQSPWLDP